ncbi:hypothetical protein [Pandoraea cepalis]|uniref:Uncharacterized protein n=1 Tax=Pandoraea cepalis TaxID=2508294 RepID=A0A5E4Y0P8_9BURK|nr:hypothetical protein [Pandoraea cepalis]VVE41858.1 hypothetical protein PCE31107_04202 [Pandoraea cepalis]
MTRRLALALAAMATSTAVCMSVLAGWQRGGWLSERLVWVAIGVVLVVSAHLLPALCLSAPIAVRGVGSPLWLCRIASASFGHATFFLLSQSHAGDLRVASTPIVIAPVHRSLAAVMVDRASVTAQLAQANARPCIGDCTGLHGRRAGLTARLEALDAEAGDIRRYQAIEDRAETRRDAVRRDPVTARLAALFGAAGSTLDLLVGLAFAAVLEATACLLWWIALIPSRQVSVTDSLAVAVTDMSVPEPLPVVPEPEAEVTRLTRDIQAGIVVPTVSGIRRHLRCSQAKAAALRRQLASATP